MRPAEPDTSMSLSINIPLPNEGAKDFHVTVSGTTGDYKVNIEGRGTVNVQVTLDITMVTKTDQMAT